jgi:hypothetical protein
MQFLDECTSANLFGYHRREDQLAGDKNHALYFGVTVSCQRLIVVHRQLGINLNARARRYPFMLVQHLIYSYQKYTMDKVLYKSIFHVSVDINIHATVGVCSVPLLAAHVSGP